MPCPDTAHARRRAALLSLLVASSLLWVGCECGPPPTEIDAAISRVDAFSAGEDAFVMSGDDAAIEGDAAIDDDAAVEGDAAVELDDAATPADALVVADDAGPLVCTSTRTVNLEASAITVLGGDYLTARRALRLRVRFTLPDGCHSPALPLVQVNAATRSVAIVPRAFVTDGVACTEVATEVTRTVTIPLFADDNPSSGTWTFWDRVTRDLLSIELRSVDEDCTPAGSCCLTDYGCDEDTGEMCLERSAPGGSDFLCAVPCEEDLECPAGSCRSTADGVPSTCQPGGGCASSADCPTNFRCDAGACLADFAIDAAHATSCACDHDCATGLRCLVGESGESTCEAPCHLPGGVECPTGMSCSLERSRCE